jgi:Xaa-Pro aminopeptidase
MDYLPAGRLAELRARLPRVRFQPADALMWRLRAVKTDEEIRRQRRAFAAASAIYRRVAQDVKPGMTVNEVRALEMSLVVAAGCAPLIFGYVTPTYNSRGMPAPKTGAGQTAGDAVLRAGDVILCDLGLVYQGYTTDFGRMLTLGAPDSRTRNAYAAILAIRQTLEASVKPGRTAGEVYAAGLRTAVECGLAADGIPYFGHSIGLECHEAPSIVKDDPTVIEKGMTLVLEVCPVVDGIWFLLENTGVVTDRGWESLTDLPTDFLVAE